MKRFTLIELLIVVAIIGILVSILMPSLNNARAASFQSVSRSNLAQIYKQFMIHVDDNNDELPGVQKIDGSEWLYWRDYLEDSFGGRQAASKLLLIPGQSYPENAGYSYSPSQTIFRKDGNTININGGRKIHNIFKPVQAYLMVEAKIVSPHLNSAYRIHWNEVVSDSDKLTSQETTRLHFPYLEKMVNLKAVGAVNTLHFKQIRDITISQWWGIDR